MLLFHEMLRAYENVIKYTCEVLEKKYKHILYDT